MTVTGNNNSHEISRKETEPYTRMHIWEVLAEFWLQFVLEVSLACTTLNRAPTAILQPQ